DKCPTYLRLIVVLGPAARASVRQSMMRQGRRTTLPAYPCARNKGTTRFNRIQRLKGIFLVQALRKRAPKKEVPAAPKLDAFDISALERSLNDSATRVSAIWVSFLIFSLYLLTVATTVTHRQLFLAEPLKLPVLDIALPLWGFFFLAPILFVIL